jgi:hypothetical protein
MPEYQMIPCSALAIAASQRNMVGDVVRGSKAGVPHNLRFVDALHESPPIQETLGMWTFDLEVKRLSPRVPAEADIQASLSIFAKELGRVPYQQLAERGSAL